jgi:hypothetical protein
MDPDILLYELRGLCNCIFSQVNEPDYYDGNDSSYDEKLFVTTAEFAEKFEALDKLIMSGGNLPKEWKEKLLGKLFSAYKNDRSISTSCHETMWDLEKAHRELFGLKDVDNIEDAEMK